jgi:hypothetical protein
MSVDAKIMTVVGAIKQSLQTASGPGSSVNTHPNPFFLNVTGEINLKHAAELIIARLEEYETALKARVEKLIKAAAADIGNDTSLLAGNDTKQPGAT